MAKFETIQTSYKIKRFTSSTERDFIKALKIYNDTIPVETKTSTNEISHFVDKKEHNSREMFFFGIYYNDEVVGYIECGYLEVTKTLIIDYITFKEEFTYNGVYYPSFALFQRFFSDNLIDVDYIITEVSIRTLEENVDKESYYARKLLVAEDFRLIDVPYPQPRLGIGNYESNFDLRLMIKSINSICSIKTETFLSIIKDIYNNHYLDWYSEFLSDDDMEIYKSHITELLTKINDNVININSIKLSDTPVGICDHYLSNECYYKSEISTAGFVSKSYRKTAKLLWILGIPLVIALSAFFSFVVYIVLKRSNLLMDEITPFFTAISATLTGLLVLIFSNKNK